MDFIIATNNKDKVREIKTILLGHNVISQGEAGLNIEAIEDGTTFAQNALIKARSIKEFSDCAIIADDSGIMVDYLDGAPGIYSARFAGEGCTPKDCNEKMLRELKGVPFEKRGAHYVCCMALILPNGEEHTFEGTCDGYIIDEERGTNGFGYDPMFYVPQIDMTFGEAPDDVKHKMSHRYFALLKLSEFIKGIE